MGANIPLWLLKPLHAVFPRIFEVLNEIGLTPDHPVLGAGSFGAVFALRKKQDGSVSPMVMKVTLDFWEIVATALIMQKVKKDRKTSMKYWERGLPEFTGLFRSKEKFRYQGPMVGMSDHVVERTPLGVIFREDLTPLKVDMRDVLEMGDFRSRAQDYARNGIAVVQRLMARPPYDVSKQIFDTTSAIEDIDQAFPEAHDIAVSLRKLMDIPLILNDLHTGNIGYRAGATPIEWSDGNFRPPLVVLDVGFASTDKREPRGVAKVLVKRPPPPPGPVLPSTEALYRQLSGVANNALDGIDII